MAKLIIFLSAFSLSPLFWMSSASSAPNESKSCFDQDWSPEQGLVEKEGCLA